ncbi:MAG TPA: sulfite exporter TauE/SafE family protein [Luteolibacter sp.]|nr:sulfite exporter TauE/SafE family protein [Luteolibacter sp.]
MTIRERPRPRLWIWFLWLVVFYAVWSVLVFVMGHLQTALDHWPMAVAMAFGSYAAGSTPMGGGTVGFPILVLLFDQPAELGRDFSFAIQSIGMTSASIFILARRQPLAGAMLKGAIIGAALGTPLGIFLVAPWIPGLWIKLVFAVVWGSFGILHLWRIREIVIHEGMTDFDEKWDQRIGFIVGLASGALFVSVSGVGIDMVLYTVLVLLCRADLKIAIPTSVIIMAFCSVLGILIKLAFTGVQPGVFGNWLAAAPIVALGAPLGVFVVQYIGRKPTLLVVAALCVGQFVWTITRESAALGITGIVLSLLAVGACLIGFEHLRIRGGDLVEAARGRRD